jgi:quercetin dioxygenase-like cupin family protein
MFKYTSWLVIGVLCGYSMALAQAPAPAEADPGVLPVRLIDRAEVRATRVEVQAGATRAPHSHTDVLYHLFIPIAGTLRLTVGSQTLDAEVGQAYFLAAGTTHGFTNIGQTPGAVMEVFIKDPNAAAPPAPIAR